MYKNILMTWLTTEKTNDIELIWSSDMVELMVIEIIIIY